MTDPVPYAREETAAQPPSLSPSFVASLTRVPSKPRMRIRQTLTETTGPAGAAVWAKLMGPAATDLTRQHQGTPIGERIIMSGRVLDENKQPVPNTIVELVQASAAGRYAHTYDEHDARLDPNFMGVGRAITGADGRYRFLTIKPDPYPWANGANTWRPSHMDFSLLGPAFATRRDPLFPLDAIACSVPEWARSRIVCRFDPATTEPYWALSYIFDFVLRGRDATLMES